MYLLFLNRSSPIGYISLPMEIMAGKNTHMLAVLFVSLILMERVFHLKKGITRFVCWGKLSAKGPRYPSESLFKIRTAADSQPF